MLKFPHTLTMIFTWVNIIHVVVLHIPCPCTWYYHGWNINHDDVCTHPVHVHCIYMGAYFTKCSSSVPIVSTHRVFARVHIKHVLVCTHAVHGIYMGAFYTCCCLHTPCPCTMVFITWVHITRAICTCCCSAHTLSMYSVFTWVHITHVVVCTHPVHEHGI